VRMRGMTSKTRRRSVSFRRSLPILPSFPRESLFGRFSGIFRTRLATAVGGGFGDRPQDTPSCGRHTALS
jgi:hypothetical protein